MFHYFPNQSSRPDNCAEFCGGRESGYSTEGCPNSRLTPSRHVRYSPRIAASGRFHGSNFASSTLQSRFSPKLAPNDYFAASPLTPAKRQLQNLSQWITVGGAGSDMTKDAKSGLSTFSLCNSGTMTTRQENAASSAYVWRCYAMFIYWLKHFNIIRHISINRCNSNIPPFWAFLFVNIVIFNI